MVYPTDRHAAETSRSASRSCTVCFRYGYEQATRLYRCAGVARPVRHLPGDQSQRLRRADARTTKSVGKATDANAWAGAVPCLSCEPARTGRCQDRQKEVGTGLVT